MSETHTEYEEWLDAAARTPGDRGAGLVLAVFALAAIIAVVVL